MVLKRSSVKKDLLTSHGKALWKALDEVSWDEPPQSLSNLKSMLMQDRGVSSIGELGKLLRKAERIKSSFYPKATWDLVQDLDAHEFNLLAKIVYEGHGELKEMGDYVESIKLLQASLGELEVSIRKSGVLNTLSTMTGFSYSLKFSKKSTELDTGQVEPKLFRDFIYNDGGDLSIGNLREKLKELVGAADRSGINDIKSSTLMFLSFLVLGTKILVVHQGEERLLGRLELCRVMARYYEIFSHEISGGLPSFLNVSQSASFDDLGDLAKRISTSVGRTLDQSEGVYTIVSSLPFDPLLSLEFFRHFVDYFIGRPSDLLVVKIVSSIQEDRDLAKNLLGSSDNRSMDDHSYEKWRELAISHLGEIQSGGVSFYHMLFLESNGCEMIYRLTESPNARYVLVDILGMTEDLFEALSKEWREL